MTSAQAKIAEHAGNVDGQTPSSPKPNRRRRIVVLGIVSAVLLVGLGAAWATGAFGILTNRGSHAASTPESGSIELPDIIANLRTDGRRTSFVRLKARLELASKLDEAAVSRAMPRLLDFFQTYLRDMRPEELRGSAGTYRLREELLARANLVLAPATVTEILFVELLVQ